MGPISFSLRVSSISAVLVLHALAASALLSLKAPAATTPGALVWLATSVTSRSEASVIGLPARHAGTHRAAKPTQVHPATLRKNHTLESEDAESSAIEPAEHPRQTPAVNPTAGPSHSGYRLDAHIEPALSTGAAHERIPVSIRWTLAEQGSSQWLSAELKASQADNPLELRSEGPLSAGQWSTAKTPDLAWHTFLQVAEQVRNMPELAITGARIVLGGGSGDASHQLVCLGDEMIDTPSGQFRTIVYGRVDNGVMQPVLWLAQAMGYAVVQQRFEHMGRTWMLRVANPMAALHH